MKCYVSLLLLSLTVLVGCSGRLQINNNGPNTIQVTANPSPDAPDLPLDIPAGQNGILAYSFFLAPTVNLQVADPTSGKFDVEQVGVPEEGTLEIDWDGEKLIVPPL